MASVDHPLLGPEQCRPVLQQLRALLAPIPTPVAVLGERAIAIEGGEDVPCVHRRSSEFLIANASGAVMLAPAPNRSCTSMTAGRRAFTCRTEVSIDGYRPNLATLKVLTVRRVNPWADSGSTRPTSRNPSFSKTLRDDRFKSQPQAHKRR